MPLLDSQPREPGPALQARFDTEGAALTVRRYRLAPRPVAPADPWRPAAEGMALALIALAATLIWIALP